MLSHAILLACILIINTRAENLIANVHRGGTVLAFGDSLTHGFTDGNPKNNHPYSSLLSEFLGTDDAVLEHGVNGERTSSMRTRLPSLLASIDKKIEVVIILGGTNDLGMRKPANVILENIMYLHEIAHEFGNRKNRKIYTIAMTIPDCDWGFNQSARDEINEGIRKFAASKSNTVGLVDLAKVLSLKSQSYFWSSDRCHFSVDGYDKIAKLILKCMEEFITTNNTSSTSTTTTTAANSLVSFIRAGGELLAFGDSLTHGLYLDRVGVHGWGPNLDTSHPYTIKLGQLLGNSSLVHESGHNGELSETMLDRLPRLLEKKQFANIRVVVILGGNNDLENKRDKQHIISNLKKLHHIVQTVGVENNHRMFSVAVTIPECSWDIDDVARKEINAELRSFASAHANVTALVDIASSEFSPVTNITLWSEDKVHFSVKGYDAIADKIFEALNKFEY